AYSPVEGARANDLPDAVPDEVRAERQTRFMEHQTKISEKRLQAKVGREIDVLVDRLAENDKGERIAVGRSKADAPEIDGLVYVTGVSKKIQPGEFLRARVVAAQEHDLVSEVVA
ncbi:MAG: 30S ribosomal protein S12 methylthiotransferase RimO, partial [Betaproteobacteria bacterium]|nr:30S ribosomal protein S12 methylthiotransferase RimO [Betaproteobacteria bacterium]